MVKLVKLNLVNNGGGVEILFSYILLIVLICFNANVPKSEELSLVGVSVETILRVQIIYLFTTKGFHFVALKWF